MVTERDIIGFTETSDVGVVSVTHDGAGNVLTRDLDDMPYVEVDEYYEFLEGPTAATFSIAARISPGSSKQQTTQNAVLRELYISRFIDFLSGISDRETETEPPCKKINIRNYYLLNFSVLLCLFYTFQSRAATRSGT